MIIPQFKSFPKYRFARMIPSRLGWRVFYHGDNGDGIYRLYGDITFAFRSEAELSAKHFRDSGQIDVDMNTSAIRVGNSDFDWDAFADLNIIRGVQS